MGIILQDCLFELISQNKHSLLKIKENNQKLNIDDGI